MANTRKNPRNPDSPFLAEDFFKKAKTFRERFPTADASAAIMAATPEDEATEQTGGPRNQETASVALSADVVRQLRATGPEWRQLAERILREALRKMKQKAA